MSEKVFILFLFILSFAFDGFTQSRKIAKDSVLFYENGQDSVLIKTANGNVLEKIFFYPDGTKKSQQTIVKDKECTGKGYHHFKYKLTTWDKNGNKLSRTRSNMKTTPYGKHKDVIWTFREEGRVCLKRSNTGWTSKY